MLKQRFKLISLLLSTMVVVALVFSGCATLQGKKAYLAANKEFTTMLEKYNSYYAAADEATKVEWKKNIDPIFQKANTALELWGIAVTRSDSGQDPVAAEENYMKIKSELFQLLIKNKII